MSSEFTPYIRDAESKASRAAGRKEADEWKREAAFLKNLQEIFEWQTGVPIRNENFPVRETGQGKDKRWDFTPDPGKSWVGEWKREAQGSFCHGAARAMALRALFGANRPSNKQVLEDLRDEITQAGDDNTKAEAIIDRICTHRDGDFAVDRYNQKLESRYNITNVKLLSPAPEAKAKLALNQDAPIIADRPGHGHWVMVQKSPRGAFWELDPLTGGLGGVQKFSRLSDLRWGGRFEIIVDAKTSNPIDPIRAETYKKDSAYPGGFDW